MITTILNKLVAVLTEELITNQNAGDPVLCKAIKIGQLQDDPTKENPHILVSPDFEKGSVAGWPDHNQNLILGEIGSGQFWTHYFRIQAKTYANSQALMISRNEELISRITDALIEHYSLDSISEESAYYVERVCAAELTVVISSKMRITGGDQDWFGGVVINVHYHTEKWRRPARDGDIVGQVEL